MLIYLIQKKEITSLRLPSVVQGNYWLSYKSDFGEDVNLVNIEANENRWIVKSNVDSMLQIDNAYQSSVALEVYNLYQIKTNNEMMYLFVMPSYDTSFGKYDVINSTEITIGRANNNTIFYNSNLVADIHTKISQSNGNWIVSNIDQKFGTYVNKEKTSQKVLIPGDTVFIMGLKIIFMGDFFAINNPNNMLRLNGNALAFRQEISHDLIDTKEDPYLNLYTEDDYFEKSPRFITKFERETVIIDAPPEKIEEEEPPLLLTIGPMMSMGMISVVMAWSSINGVINEGRSMATAVPSLVMAVAMLMTILLWPMLTKRYQKKQKKKKEIFRQEEYKNYLEIKNKEIEVLMNRQRQVLLDNNVTLEECSNIIMTKKRNLWEREIDQDDFLTVRLGIGTIRPDIDIRYPEEHFSLVKDNLKDILEKTISKNKVIENVPIKISLASKNKVALVGDRFLTDSFLESLLIQIMAFHSYRDLKIIYLTSGDSKRFECLKKSSHLFSDNNEIRFYGTNPDEIKQICNYLSQVYNSRKYTSDNKISKEDYKRLSTYYLIIIDDLKTVRNIGVIKEILGSEINYGFTLLIRGKNLVNLPSECSTFITISGENGKTSGFFENELTTDKQQAFVADLNIMNRVNLVACIKSMANIPIKSVGGIQELPKTLSFLEMYNVGNINQLNATYRWQVNNPTVSLQVPVGVDETGEQFKLDLHEKAHGPHGLIAGMTGSGKSEFIITYILSLAINYHPNEVSFVLIDYKGGGLAGAFENRETGVSLPHLAGTITNLDTSEMNRALSSIQSELRRRQKIFNKARDKLGESTIDIYKYQRLYRDGKVDIPVSHLFVISDEFAELKMQQPEFMDQLISAARIGRSLGVHLILATQKPSGVVNDQIWSNSKFRVCLKVQDKTDSMDMIKCSDAAALKDVGRFYLQVGYNEYFALGQSAWCGAPYYPMEKRQKKIDTSLDFINNVGTIIKSSSDNNGYQIAKAQGEELPNIVKYLVDIAGKSNIKVDKLWLDKIPAEIFVSKLKEKYNYESKKNIINPIIGEFDDPNNQRQGLLTLPLSKNGNTIIYGIGGSGKEDLLTTMIYSTIINHGADEVNFYLLDFGSEFLRLFAIAPQVGDVVTSTESDKIENLFKLLNTIIDDRKEILAKYNGDVNLYNQKSEKSLPTIILVINNYEAFSEIYESYNDLLITLSRDCVRYGVIIVLTVSGVNSVRYRLSQNFKQLIPLQLNDNSDYISVIGRTGGVFPAQIIGRGLVKLDEVYEFQTAYVHEKASITPFIKKVCETLNRSVTVKAPRIPVLPNKVTEEILRNKLISLSNVPVGIYKDDLDIALYNFKNKYVTLVTGNSVEGLSMFVNPLLRELASLKKTNVIAIDAGSIIKPLEQITLCNSKFDDVIERLSKYINSMVETYNKNNYDLKCLSKFDDIVCVISGVSSFYKRLKPESKAKFEKLLQDGSEVKKVIFIIVDIADELKSQEYSAWYKSVINVSEGLWIGSGLYDQYLIKVGRFPAEAKLQIENNLGFIIQRSSIRMVKFLEGDINDK